MSENAYLSFVNSVRSTRVVIGVHRVASRQGKAPSLPYQLRLDATLRGNIPPFRSPGRRAWRPRRHRREPEARWRRLRHPSRTSVPISGPYLVLTSSFPHRWLLSTTCVYPISIFLLGVKQYTSLQRFVRPRELLPAARPKPVRPRTLLLACTDSGLVPQRRAMGPRRNRGHLRRSPRVFATEIKGTPAPRSLYHPPLHNLLGRRRTPTKGGPRRRHRPKVDGQEQRWKGVPRGVRGGRVQGSSVV